MNLALARPLLLAVTLCFTTPACAQQPAPASAETGNNSAGAATEPAPAIYNYRIVHTYPHDHNAFTQGLFYLNGKLYESTGQIGQSTIRHVNIEDGRVLQSVPIPPGLFGEGIVNFGNEIVSITWQGGNGYRWDLATLRRTGEWHYSGEGWGLTQNGTDIIMSDGTSAIRFLDPVTLAERRRITVTLQGVELTQLNELEWVNGEIFANIWQTPRIARIDPASGRVTGIIDLTGIANVNTASADAVLNGIAYDAQGDRLFVTGKLWPRLYEIDLVPAPAR
jgi:glutamine cyclotransferase